MVWTATEGMAWPEASLNTGRFRFNRPLQYESVAIYQPFTNRQVFHKQLCT